MSFDPFRPEDAGDDSAIYQPKKARRASRLVVALVAIGLLLGAGLVAVIVT